ncbi:MAG: DNA cytosine methyltransferase [Cyclobacteriaceae bacterium]
MIYVIDLFCGAGGYTEGIERAKAFGKKAARVIACVNHDPYAIKSHRINHSRCWHFVEDIRTLDIGPIAAMVRTIRKREPDCVILLHASCECQHHSKARGGLTKKADSRTLHDHLERYIDVINPDILTVENVVEFRTAGPLRIKCESSTPILSNLAIDKNGELLYVANKEKSGESFREWISTIKSYGYTYDDRDINAADFGAHTKRIRYFGQFVKKNMPIVWPTPTHAKNPTPGSGLRKWKAVKEVLDFSDQGHSIFKRKKPLVAKSLKRILSGAIKYVAGGQKMYEEAKERYYSHVNNLGSQFLIEQPDRFVTSTFIQQYYSNGGNKSSIHQPLGAITTKARSAVVICDSIIPVEVPRGHDNLIYASSFIARHFSGGGQHSSIEQPAGALTTIPKMNLVNIEPVLSEHYLVNPQYSSKGGSVEDPCFTLIARMDKSPVGIISIDLNGQMFIPIEEDDCETTIAIKEFMAIYGISDIKNRMLRVDELKLIQGFPANYYLAGNQARQLKAIGNSVAPCIPKAWIQEMAKVLRGNRASRMRIAA